jgi:predicted RecB family endonuclease
MAKKGKIKIEIELTNILLDEINEYLKKNEDRIDRSGLEIFCAVITVLTVLAAQSDYEPELIAVLEFMEKTFIKKVEDQRLDDICKKITKKNKHKEF